MRTKTSATPTRDRVVAASVRDLLARPAYLNLEERSVLRYGTSSDAANLAKVLAIPSDVFWPSPMPDAESMWKACVLSARDISADPFLSEVQRRLPRERRLWVAIWPDLTVAMTALPRTLKAVRIWWLGMVHDAAQCAPDLARLTAERERTRTRSSKEPKATKP
jgi:hypothetical protein